MKNTVDFKAPIPQLEKGITINRGDKNKVLYTVFPYYSQTHGYSQPTRVVIGKAIDDKTLIPNNNYRKYFPDLWKTVSNEDVPMVSKKAGLYALVNSLAESNGLREILETTFGISATDAVLDYVMYSIGYHSNVAMNFMPTMKEHVLFSDTIHDDSYYSRLFTEGITETQINLFRIRWAKQCAEQGLTSVYLAIDGSNDDCSSKGVELAEKGAAKSKKNTDIISFMYAVEPESGKVVTFDTYRGGLVDSKAILRTITFLKENGIEVKGVIIDRGFCDSKCLGFLRSKDIPYILMMKGNTAGHRYMMDMHRDELRWNGACWIPDTLLFAVSETARLFDNSPIADHLHLYYDFRNGDARCEALLNRLSKAVIQAESGKIPQISADIADILTVTEEDGHVSYCINEDRFREELEGKGYFTIAASETMDSRSAYKMYAARDAAETEFAYVKTQLGYGAVRVQSDMCALSRFMVGAVCAVIRSDAERACRELNKKTNSMIHEIRNISISCYNASTYTMVHTEKNDVKELFRKLNIDTADLDEIAVYETRKLNGETGTIRKKKPGPKKGSHHQQYDSQGTPLKKKPGPKPGSHHRKKDENGNIIKAKPGPKPGSHHRKRSTASDTN